MDNIIRKADNFEVLQMSHNRKYSDELVNMEVADGILYFGFQPGVHITLEMARGVVSKRYEFCEGKDYPVLIEDAGMKGLEKDARDFFSGPEGMKNISAGALLATNTFNRFLGNFVLNIAYANSKVPARLFDSREEALKWLQQFK